MVGSRRAMLTLMAVAVLTGLPSPASATVSGDNGRIAYVSTIDGDLEIYSVNPDGTDPINLTKAHGVEGLPIDDSEPAWSPDGRLIAFRRSTTAPDAAEPTILSEVWVMDADGSHQRRLGAGWQPTWSPDGSSIAFVTDAVGAVNGLPTTVIASVPSTGGGVTILTDPGHWVSMSGALTSTDHGPVWSPDGATIYFTRYRTPATPTSQDSDVMAVDVAAGAVRLVLDDVGTRVVDMDVSPDGTQLATMSYTMNPPIALRISAIDGLSSTTLMSDYYVAHGVSYSPSGDHLAVTLNDARMMPPSFIWTMTTNGTDRTKLIEGSQPAWQPVNPYAFGFVDPSQGKWYLRHPDGRVDSFYYGNPGDVPFVGDWDCDGLDTPGLYRQSDGYVYLRNTSTQGIADLRFYFGNPGDVPLAGDFDGDGCDTVSLYRPSNETFYIINKLGSEDQGLGAAEVAYVFGNPGDKPFVGDFDGDGVDTIGLHRESSGLVYYRNTHTQGIADHQFIYGDPGDRIVAADWNGNGIDSPGLFRPSRTTVYLRFTNTQGNADAWFMFGEPGWLPVAGTFNAP